MAKIERFEDLDIWKEAVSIGVDVYNLTSAGRLEKDYSAKDQLRRAAISISNNIAEEFEYNNNKVFVKFLRYAKAPAGELRSNLFVLKEADIINESNNDKLQSKLLAISKNIGGFIKYLRTLNLIVWASQVAPIHFKFYNVRNLQICNHPILQSSNLTIL